MKQINWNAEKNQQLMSERSVSFEDVLFTLQSGGLLDDGPHPNKKFFLKTIIPSRKATKKFLGGQYG